MKIGHSDTIGAKPTIFSTDGHSLSSATPLKTDKNHRAPTGREATVAAVMPPAPDRILINELEGANEEIRAIARQARAVDDTMGAIEENLKKMTSQLEGIVKHYPPYLGNDPERIESLRNFGGLRQLIDQLTLPPPEDSPAQILGDSAQFPEAGDWELAIEKGQAPVIIRHQPVHSGADGLDLPDLATNASDEAVRNALERMNKSRQTLHQRRQTFAVDAKKAMASLL